MPAHAHQAPARRSKSKPATTEWLAAQTFDAWDLTDLQAPSDEEWAARAFVVRLALEVMGRSKAELTAAPGWVGVATAVELLRQLRDTHEFLEQSALLVQAAATRYDAALSAAAVARKRDRAVPA